MAGRLAGKRAVITGAAQGIGKAIATRFGAEGAELLLASTDSSYLTGQTIYPDGGRLGLNFTVAVATPVREHG